MTRHSDGTTDIITQKKKTEESSNNEKPFSEFTRAHYFNLLQEKLEKPPIEIDPKRCKPWIHHNRDFAWLTKERCHDLITSIKKYGQYEPVLVRKLKGDPNYEFEIIYGVRRWFACSQLNQKVWAYVTELADKACMILMHSENADSKDISEFERAFSFAQQLKSGVFKNQTEMAEAMGLTQHKVLFQK